MVCSEWGLSEKASRPREGGGEGPGAPDAVPIRGRDDGAPRVHPALRRRQAPRGHGDARAMIDLTEVDHVYRNEALTFLGFASAAISNLPHSY